MHLVWIAVFCAMQAIAHIFFTHGSRTPGRWLVCFILGNVFGASSIWFLMLLYRRMNPNLALGIVTGGAFLCAQGAVAVLFRSRLSLMQYAAMLAIAVGMAVFSIWNKG